MRRLRIGTRGSRLALVQARTVAASLDARGTSCELVVIRTSGDRLDGALSEAGGKGLFVKEIEEAILAGDVDLAVHSSKDLPAALPEGLRLAAVLPREDARDAVVLRPDEGTSLTLDALTSRFGAGSRLATSSIRRVAQLRALFPAASFVPMRGNVDTRLRKLEENADTDALVLAAAGLARLGYTERVSAYLPLDVCVPAPGQGVIAIETRAGDPGVEEPVARLNDADAWSALEAERAVVARLGGGCQMPLGAHATLAQGTLSLTAVVLSLDGSRAVRASAQGTATAARALGDTAAEQLLAAGADTLLAEAHARLEGRSRA